MSLLKCNSHSQLVFVTAIRNDSFQQLCFPLSLSRTRFGCGWSSFLQRIRKCFNMSILYLRVFIYVEERIPNIGFHLSRSSMNYNFKSKFDSVNLNTEELSKAAYCTAFPFPWFTWSLYLSAPSFRFSRTTNKSQKNTPKKWSCSGKSRPKNLQRDGQAIVVAKALEWLSEDCLYAESLSARMTKTWKHWKFWNRVDALTGPTISSKSCRDPAQKLTLFVEPLVIRQPLKAAGGQSSAEA